MRFTLIPSHWRRTQQCGSLVKDAPSKRHRESVSLGPDQGISDTVIILASYRLQPQRRGLGRMVAVRKSTSNVRITFGYSNLQEVINSITEILDVGVQAPGWREHSDT